MLTLIFFVLLLTIFGKILAFSIKAAWGITKILCTVVFVPLILIIMVICGLMYVALPILAIIGIVALVYRKNNSHY